MGLCRVYSYIGERTNCYKNKSGFRCELVFFLLSSALDVATRSSTLGHWSSLLSLGTAVK